MISSHEFESVREYLLSVLVEKSFKYGDVTLSSGKKSNFYINVKKACIPRFERSLGLAMFEIILQHHPDVRAAGGLTMGADPLAHSLSVVSSFGSEIIAFSVRKEPKKHGTQEWLEGPDLEPSTRVAILEDVITTGASALKAIERVRVHGLLPVCVVAVVDREEENGRQNLEATGLPVYSLFSKRDFIPTESTQDY